jgi:hypothetical protein
VASARFKGALFGEYAVFDGEMQNQQGQGFFGKGEIIFYIFGRKTIPGQTCF